MARIGENFAKSSQNFPLGWKRHEIAAVRALAARQRLGFERLEAAGFAGAHVVIEGALMLAPAVVVDELAANTRPRHFERQAIEPALGVVKRLVDARELFFGHDVGAEAVLKLRQTLVVRLLEGAESAIEIGENIVAGGFGFDC